jgi:hypothetical protein
MEDVELSKDERIVLFEYRQLKHHGHGDMGIEISVKDHDVVKIWTTRKRDLSDLNDKVMREARS